ncbi:MAG: tyrosine-type recombinase/integrase [Lachnospiraceae bacterium]|nr:tyrosine-type recombinase/integrase [Lachnospiraceae bacterium]
MFSLPFRGQAPCNQYGNLCDKIGISRKSAHKIRKTYISTLLDAGVNPDTVREQAGHEDLRVTYKNYFFDRKSKPQIEEQMERVWASNQ